MINEYTLIDREIMLLKMLIIILVILIPSIYDILKI